MPTQNPYDKYKNNTVYTATKEELTLMLYDGALKFCNQAIVAVESKDFMKANELIIRVQDIIREFQVTLNRSVEISKYFDSMYDYMYARLLDANIKKDIEILTEVRDLVREFRDMWKDAMKLARQSTAKVATY
jgi:flagellar protein FliS